MEVTAKSSVVKTAEVLLGLKELDNGATPLEALKEWDIPIKLYRNEKEYLCNLFRDSSCSIIATLQSDLRNTKLIK